MGFKLYVLIPIFGRWILMTAWILTIETNYHQNAWAEKAFQMIMGFLNVFLFFNMKDGSSKDVIIIYYSLNFLEGALLLALWYPARDMSATYNELLMGISISCFFLSLVMMCLYYSYFHPNRLSHAESEDISELEKYWNETLSTENEKSRSLPRFRSLEPYSLTLARRESENNREDSYQLSAPC